MGLTAVVFDLDYTLAVPDRDRQTLLNEATASVGAVDIDREAYLGAHRENLTGETREPIFADLLAEREADADPTELAGAYRRAIADAIRPIDGAADLVRELRKRYRVGLLTNGPVRAQRDKLRTLGWEDLFDAVVVTGDLDAGKPDGRAFEAALDALDVEADEAVYVGDEVEADVRGADAAGLRVVQVVSPDGPDPDPTADAHVDRAELVTCLPLVIADLD
ncbi:HAD family hydrolase [Halostella sp. JP-L12]|uniref:HAD family hydrolase n=1 Tax=Halostella TaxID=1843185 RepID=UPI000EF83171|nr:MULTISPECIES: HAD family hydrolase [Halostella]NHN47262.1 HAD family hydrolase [Halostella sp. JP-L12]